MTYIPDYREDADKLLDYDKCYWDGYKEAMEDARNNFQSMIEDEGDEYIEDIFDDFEVLCDASEREMFLSIIEDDLYSEVEFHDANKYFKRNDKH